MPLQPGRPSLAVESLVVMVDNVEYLAAVENRVEDAPADFHMLHNVVVFLVGERAFLVEDGFPHADLADVVEHRR